MAARKKARQTQKPAKSPAPAKTPPLWLLLWGSLLAALVIFISLAAFAFYYNAQEYILKDVGAQGIRVSLFSPQYLSVGDEEQVRVTVVNERGTPAQITVTLVYTGSFLCLTGDDESHRLDLGTVYPQERITRKLTASFPPGLGWQAPVWRNFPAQPVELGVWLAVDGRTIQKETLSLFVNPLIKARTIGNVAASITAGLALWLGKETWELIKKKLEPLTAKTESKA